MKYHLARDGDKLGEYSDLEISAGLRRGEFRATDLCWSAGMKDWQPLAERFPPPEPSADPEDEAELRWSAVPEAAGPEMASRWLRFLAWWVDWLTLLPVMMLISSALQLDAFAEKNQNLQPDQFVIAFQNHMQEMMQSMMGGAGGAGGLPGMPAGMNLNALAGMMGKGGPPKMPPGMMKRRR